MKKYVITGGPCSGKTTMIYAISSRGFDIFQEASRKIMKKYGIHPKDDFINFQKIVMKEQIEIERSLEKCNFNEVFLDRSIIDSYTYSKLGGLEYPEKIQNIIKNTDYDKVFFLGMLEEYKPDKERLETEEAAKHIGNELYKAYLNFGYDPVDVPDLPFEERVDFILNKIR